MATLVINNLDMDIVARFEALAKKLGISQEGLRKKAIVEMLDKYELPESCAVNKALSAMPQLEIASDEDIFAMPANAMRDIDWQD